MMFEIRPAAVSDYDRIVDIWESSVRATHHFLSEADILYYKNQIREHYLAQVELFVVQEGSGRLKAFSGLTSPDSGGPARVEMLFVEAEAQGFGLGRALIEQAAGRYGALELEVNEQNPGAGRFYEKMGFKLIGRSEVDGEGRPFPLLKMRREKEPV